MERIKYRIIIKGQAPIEGSCQLRLGRVTIAPELPEGMLESVTATMHVDLAAGEKIFMNGYQTWTYCPEYDREGHTRRWAPLPKKVVDHFSLDRYGDYHFVDYPQKGGITHGESYCYFRRGESFRLIASLDERPGYTLLRYDSGSHELRLERDCAGLRCCGVFHAFDLFLAEGNEDTVFDAWFRELGVQCRTKEKIAGYSSWYNRYQNIDQLSIGQDLEGCALQLHTGDLFQIDDGWEPAVGDWLAADEKKFPDGMKKAADDIHGRGLRAGLWLAPFVAEKDSALFREHPDWFLQVDGGPWRCGCNWSGFYALDIDKPQVVDYLERVFDRVLNEWGYDLVKLDFLYGAAPFGSETETRAGRMIRAMELLRRLCGDKLILGCGVPLMPAFGLVAYCRVSCDVSLDWDDKPHMRLIHRERVSTRQAIGNSIFRRQLNGRAWLSDPDVFFLRRENVKLSDEQKHILATVNSLFGGVLLHSDNMARYDSLAKVQYAQLLRNRNAANIRVYADEGLSVTYELDGAEHSLRIE